MSIFYTRYIHHVFNKYNICLYMFESKNSILKYCVSFSYYFSLCVLCWCLFRNLFGDAGRLQRLKTRRLRVNHSCHRMCLRYSTIPTIGVHAVGFYTVLNNIGKNKAASRQVTYSDFSCEVQPAESICLLYWLTNLIDICSNC